jgi:hypothetical protein
MWIDLILGGFCRIPTHIGGVRFRSPENVWGSSPKPLPRALWKESWVNWKISWKKIEGQNFIDSIPNLSRTDFAGIWKI